MRRVFALAAVASIACTAGAHAYNIKHSYSAPGNATEFYGQCSNGKEMMLVKGADGRFSYEGPQGKGTLNGGGSLDAAAKAACGE
ncbi:MAG: hypothetical protein AB8G17_21335 [Gammaproteobacteria bacterium]